MEKYRTFKVEIAPTAVQKEKIAQYQGVCRFVYNLYLAENEKRWKAEKELAKKEGRKPKSTLMCSISGSLPFCLQPVSR